MKCFLINSPINPIMSNSRYNNAAIKIQCFLKNILYQISKFCNRFSAQSLSTVKNIVSEPWIFQSMSSRHIDKSRSCHHVGHRGSLGFYSCLDMHYPHNCHRSQNHNRWDHWTNRKYHLDTFHHNSQVNMDLSKAIFKTKLRL